MGPYDAQRSHKSNPHPEAHEGATHNNIVGAGPCSDRPAPGLQYLLHPGPSQAVSLKNCGGGDRIRTCDALTGIPVFKTGALSHSATPPCQLKFYLNATSGGVVQCWQEGQ